MVPGLLVRVKQIAARNDVFYIGLIGILAISIACACFMLPSKGMSPVWSVPYFSGSMEWSLSEGWLFQPAEVDAYKKLTGWDIYFYRFNQFPSLPLIKYELNTSGYLYLVWLAVKIFPFLGPVGAIVLLQVLTHIGVCVFLASKMETRLEKTMFLLLYAANPLVLYFVFYPFYYFWQMISSFVLLYYYRFNVQGSQRWLVHIGLAFLVFVGFAIRSTTILVLISTWVLLLYRKQFRAFICHTMVYVFLGLIWFSYLEKVKGYGPWHNAFIGFAGYPNRHADLKIMNDDTGYAYYNKYSGAQIDASIEGNFTTDVQQAQSYYAYMKSMFFELVKKNPLEFVRNLLLNYFQGFSVGYLTKLPFIGKCLVAISGFLIVLFFINRKFLDAILIISVSHLTFSFYYPPIPAYMYGSYILIVILFIDALINRKRRTERI
jgi:hypothetical protein